MKTISVIILGSFAILFISCTGANFNSTYFVTDYIPQATGQKIELSKFLFNFPEKGGWRIDISNNIDSIECVKQINDENNNKLVITVIRKPIDSLDISVLSFKIADAILDNEYYEINKKCDENGYYGDNMTKFNSIWNKNKFYGISFQVKKRVNSNICLSDNLIFILLLPDYSETKEYYFFKASESLYGKWEAKGSRVFDIEKVLKSFQIIYK